MLLLSPRLLAVFRNVAILVVAPRSPRSHRAPAPPPSRSTATVLEVGILGDLNDVRAAHGLRPLKLSPTLTAAARQHTFEMLDDGYFKHESVNGAPFWKRVEQDYPKGSGNWEVGENPIWCSPSLCVKKALNSGWAATAIVGTSFRRPGARSARSGAREHLDRRIRRRS
jgi:uncharacterized protein YkwD